MDEDGNAPGSGTAGAGVGGGDSSMASGSGSSTASASAAAVGTSQMITGLGRAPATLLTKENAINNFNKFCAAPEQGYRQFEDMTPEEFCDETVMYKYSYWLAYVYQKHESDENLMMRTVIEYIRKVMNVGKAKFGSPDTMSGFFYGLEPSSPATHWYKAMLKNVEKVCARKAIDRGMKITESPPSIGRKIVGAMVLAYFEVGTADSMLRRLIILLILLVCGRVGEVATTTWTLISWDPILLNLYFNWSQPKTSKQKGIGLVADKKDPMMDINKAFGDLFITGYFDTYRTGEGDGDTNDFLFPTFRLASEGGAAKKISRYIQDISPHTKTENRAAKYRNVTVNSIPPKATGGSIRVGSLCEMDAANVFPQRMAAVSGHELTGFSAMWEYILVTPMSTMPGTLIGSSFFFPAFICPVLCALYAMCFVLCALCFVLCALCFVLCALCALCSVLCALCSVLCAL